MRAIIQRVSRASVTIEGKIHSSIDKGLLILLGIETDDTADDIKWLVHKIVNMRIFSDEQGLMNLSLQQVEGSILVISQFTLFASTKKGNRPSFLKSARPEIAIPLYEAFLYQLGTLGLNIAEGIFGADMKVDLCNDGPVTIIMDSKNKE